MASPPWTSAVMREKKAPKAAKISEYQDGVEFSHHSQPLFLYYRTALETDSGDFGTGAGFSCCQGGAAGAHASAIWDVKNGKTATYIGVEKLSCTATNKSI